MALPASPNPRLRLAAMTSRRGGSTLRAWQPRAWSVIRDRNQPSTKGGTRRPIPHPQDQHARTSDQYRRKPTGSPKGAPMSNSDTPTVVLVHGGFVDGSGWQGVYEHLTKDGYRVSVVQNPTVSLADDVAVTKRAIEAASDAGHPRRPLLRRGRRHRGRHAPQGWGARLHRGLRPRRGRVGQHAHRRSAARRIRAADSPAAGRVSLPRPREVPCFVRRGPECRGGRFHGRLAGPVGP